MNKVRARLNARAWSREVEPVQCAPREVEWRTRSRAGRAREVEQVARAREISPESGKLGTSLIRVRDKYIDMITVAAVSL